MVNRVHTSHIRQSRTPPKGSCLWDQSFRDGGQETSVPSPKRRAVLRAGARATIPSKGWVLRTRPRPTSALEIAIGNAQFADGFWERCYTFAMRMFRSFLLPIPILAFSLMGASSAFAQPYFQPKANAISSQNWTNYARLTDIDNDGDLDILLPNADGFGGSQGDPQPFVIYRNDGNFTFTDVSQSAVEGFSGYIRQVATADISGDGFVDMYAPDAWGGADKFFINDGTGKFKDEAATRLPNVNSRAGATRFGDVDNDGDMDLMVGDDYSELNGGVVAHLYLNNGSGVFAESAWQMPTATGQQPIDFDWLDMYGDFDLDLFVDAHFGKGSLWQNDGTGKFIDFTANLPGQSGNKYGPVSCDVDGDGDMDLWQDNSGPDYTEQLMINDGTGKYTDETAARVTGNPSSDDNGLACIDIDNDGDLDAMIFNLGPAERLLVNDGNGNFTYQAGAFPNAQDSTLWIEFGDLDGDGRLDYVSAQGEGSSLDKVFAGVPPLAVDNKAPNIRAVETAFTVTSDDAPVVRFAVVDQVTTDEGPRLKKAYLKITSPSAEEVKAMFMGGDLFRGVLPKQAGGSDVSFQACAMDRQGNEGCSNVVTYKVAGGGPGSGGGGTGGMGAGASGGGGAGASGGGGANGGNGGTGGGNGGGGANEFDLTDGGCGCSLPGTPPPSSALLVGVLGCMAGVARRLRRSQRRRHV